jgi:hypothetical protein
MSNSKKKSSQIIDDIKEYQTKILKILTKTDLEKLKQEWKQETKLEEIPNEEINYYMTDFNPEEQTPEFNENYLKILKLWDSIPYIVKPVSFYEFTENYDTLSEELKRQILDNNTKLKEIHFPKESLTKSKRLSSVKKLTKQHFEKINYEDILIDKDRHKISWFFQKDNDKSQSDNYKELIEFIIFRVDDLLRCSQEEGKYEKVTKEYFSNEGAHEFKLLTDYIKDLINIYSKDESTHKHIDNMNEYTIETIKVLFTDIYDEIKNKEALEEINKKFALTFFETYKLSERDISFPLKKEEIPAFEEFINANDKIEYKILKTFFPLELIKKYFVETNDGVKLTEAYKKIDKDEISSVHNNLNKQQILGFYLSLQKYEKYKQWYWIRNSVVPNTCSYRTSWSLSTNNLFTYLFTLNDKKLFPIRFTITPSTDKYIVEDIRMKDNLVTIYAVYIKPDFIRDYIFLGITLFVFRDTNNKLFRKYFFYFCDKEKKNITIVDERSNVYKFGNVFQHRPTTSIEFTQIVDYSKNNLFAYRFKKGTILPEQYTKTLFFTCIKEEDMTETQKKVIKELNLEKISFERKLFHGIKYYIIKADKKSIINSIKGGNQQSMLKLDLSNDFLAFDRIAGNFYDTFENYTINRYYKNPPKELENLFFFERVVKETAYLYLYPFSGYQYYWHIKIKIPEHNIKPLYEPFTYDFYAYHEIYKLFLYKNLRTILIIGNSPGIIEVLQYNNHLLENSYYVNIKYSSKLYKQKLDFEEKVIKFINKHNIDIKIIDYTDNIYNLLNQSLERTELFVYNNFEYIEGIMNHTSHLNILNIFIGMLCGLKYTELGGTFVLYLD